MSGRHIISHRDYKGAANFCGELAQRFDSADIIVCKDSWLAAPLQYIYGKSTLQISDQGAAESMPKCKRALELMEEWLAKKKRVFYITDGGDIFTKTLDFTLVEQIKLETVVLERCRGYPRQIERFNPLVKIFKVQLHKDAPDHNLDQVVDIGQNPFGLISGFHSAEVSQGISFRWTKAISELIIPWPGGPVPVELTLRVNGGRPQGVPPAALSIFIDGQMIKSLKLTNEFKEYRMVIPPVPEVDTRRVLRLETGPWSPKVSGISGDSRELGAQIDWIGIRKCSVNTVSLRTK